MIVPNQSNLRIHFAGCEDIRNVLLLNNIADINYTLFSVYKFIRKKQNNDKAFIDKLQANTRHCIMDSGLFTLMFGAEKGEQSEEFLNTWTDRLIEFVKETGFKGTVVEIDCQKVLGVDQAWRYRKYMRENLPDNRVINVFHIEDGQKGLDKLIEYSDYIAISVPELRFNNRKEYLYRLYSYIKNKRPELDIHLLGFTEFTNLDKYKHATSCDSISWKQTTMYGRLVSYSNGELVKGVSNRVKGANKNMVDMKEYTQHIYNQYKDDLFIIFGDSLTDKTMRNLAVDAHTAMQYRRYFESKVGTQE